MGKKKYYNKKGHAFQLMNTPYEILNIPAGVVELEPRIGDKYKMFFEPTEEAEIVVEETPVVEEAKVEEIAPEAVETVPEGEVKEEEEKVASEGESVDPEPVIEEKVEPKPKRGRKKK